MRAVRLAPLWALIGLLGWVLPARAATAPTSAQTALTRAVSRQLRQLGRYSGAYAQDLSTGQTLYAANADKPRLPASVEKLYTTTATLLTFGPAATLTTSVLATGTVSASGMLTGTLYLRGAGDPTFGSAAFDRANYGTGATVQQLVANLVHATHLRAFKGRIVGDSSALDGDAGTVASGYGFDTDIEGSLSALPFNRGLSSSGAQIVYPAAYAAGQLVSALRAAHVHLARHVATGAGHTPAAAHVLASVSSPPVAQLIALTNTPSDNFFAEMLTKDLGMHFGAAGSTAGGVAVIRALLSEQFGLAPSFDDGSGLSRDDATTPRQVVTLLSDMQGNTSFTRSLAVAGKTGTLVHEMVGTRAQGRCIGKTGTLTDVASLAGYCHAADGHLIAFAFLANRLGNTDVGHALEANMAVALAKYDG